jgi:triacylglycerol lipase
MFDLNVIGDLAGSRMTRDVLSERHPLIHTRLEAPVVLAHGLFGFDRIGLGRFTLSSYFRRIPEHLRAAGNRVMVTRVPPIAGIKSRAKRLGEQIESVFGTEPIHLVGHSMGGLDARHLVGDPQWAGRILSLTTIGTPHLGSALADCARNRVGRVYRVLRTLGIDHRGFHDVTRRAARAVNRERVAQANVPAYAIAGDPVEADVCWPLKPFFELLGDLEGKNDGLVSVESALGFGTPLPSWPVDHLRQMNWMPPERGPSSSRAILELYDGVFENLAQQGFSTLEQTEPGTIAYGGGVRPRERAEHSGEDRRIFRLYPLLGRRPVEQNGNGHVAQHVGRGAEAVEEPVDSQQNGDLVGGKPDGSEDQGQGDETARRDPPGADAGDERRQYDDQLIDRAQ